MRWFGGRTGYKHPHAPVPEGAQTLWAGHSPLWLVGNWPEHVVKTYDNGHRRVAVIGPCTATQADLAALLTQDNIKEAPLWAGSYTIVIADDHRTTILTDPGGANPIYTMPSTKGTVWASSSRALAPLTGNEVDIDWIAASLLSATDSVAGRSAFSGVCSVEAGSQLTLRPDLMPEIRAVWKPTRTGSREAALELGRALHEGVAVRVENAAAPASDCSGGFDSTSLCLLAEKYLQPEHRLLAVTMHGEGLTGGDLAYARAALKGHSRIDHLLMPMNEGFLPFSRLHDIPATDEPAPSTITYAQFAAQLELLVEAGVDCHFTGDGGDAVLWQPNRLADFARSLRWLKLLRHAQGLARLYEVSPWPFIQGAFFPNRSKAVPTPDWITQQTRLRAASVPGSEPAWRGCTPSDKEMVLGLRMVGRTARTEAQIAEHFGVDLHNPFTDSRVVDAALSAPRDDRGSVWRYKPMLAMALGDAFPTVIAERTTKGSFDAEHYQGIRANHATILELIDGHLAELGLIEPRLLRAVANRAASSVKVFLGTFEPVLATEVWLRAQQSTAPVAWTTEPLHLTEGTTT